MLIERNRFLVTVAIGTAGLGVGAGVATAADSSPRPTPKPATSAPAHAKGTHLDEAQMASMMRHHHELSPAVREGMRTMHDEMMRTP